MLGEGPIDIVVVPGFISHLDLDWGAPPFERFAGRLASFSRLIRFDKRGTGLSDPVPGLRRSKSGWRTYAPSWTLPDRNAPRCFGYSEGGPMSALFAATYPERTLALVLYGTFPAADAREQGRRIQK